METQREMRVLIKQLTRRVNKKSNVQYSIYSIYKQFIKYTNFKRGNRKNAEILRKIARHATKQLHIRMQTK